MPTGEGRQKVCGYIARLLKRCVLSRRNLWVSMSAEEVLWYCSLLIAPARRRDPIIAPYVPMGEHPEVGGLWHSATALSALTSNTLLLMFICMVCDRMVQTCMGISSEIELYL